MMATIVQSGTADAVRVASVIEEGKVKPVWFERIDKPGRERVFVRKVNSMWTSHAGSSKIINFATTCDMGTFHLSFNTEDVSWTFAAVEEVSFGI
jgi:hypothetical protein